MQEERITTPPVRAIFPQICLSCVVFLCCFAAGMSIGHSAVLLPHLQLENSTLALDEDMGSWIASVYSLVAPIGGIFGGLSIDIFGRKKVTIVGSFSLFLGWLLIACAQNVSMILVGRIVEGISRNIIATSVTVLGDELADPRFRGNILCGAVTFVSAGIAGISSLGAFLHWRTASGVASIFSLLSAITLFFVRESAIWLIRKNKTQEAERVLKYIWGPGKESQVMEEIDDLKLRLHLTESHRKITFVRKLFKPYVLKPLLIIHFFSSIQAFCGLHLFTVYAVDILSKIRSTGREILNDYFTIILISSLRTSTVFLVSLITNRIGRRKLSIFSGTCSLVSSLSLGLLLLPGDPLISEHIESYIVFCLVIIFVVSMSSGFLILPNIMMGETQALSFRGVACGYIYTINEIILGGVVKFYPKLMFTLEIHGLFLMFGVSCAVCTIFVFLFLPETQGLTLQQIEDYFRQPNMLWARRRRNGNKVNQTEESDSELIIRS